MGGEQLLFLLFVLFSVISALLGRRKRKKAPEAAQGGVPVEAREERVEEDMEEEVGGWPFPMGGDSFEPRPKRQPPRQTPAPDETADGDAEVVPVPASREPEPTWIERLKRAAQEVDGQAHEVVERAQEAATEAQRIQPKQRVEELIQKRLAAAKAQEERVVEEAKRRRRRRRWTLTPDTAKEAIVYAEILGPPKSERREEFP